MPSSTTASYGGDGFEARLAAAMAAAEQGGGMSSSFFGGGGGGMANSPVGTAARDYGDVKAEAKRQNITKAQLMHAQMHKDSSPLSKMKH